VEICGGGQDESPDQPVTAWWNSHLHPQATFYDMSLQISLNSINTETFCIKKLILCYHTWDHCGGVEGLLTCFKPEVTLKNIKIMIKHIHSSEAVWKILKKEEI
jgi:metal-dependent hydrolase (beta-lactamase superfamily II)